MKEIYKKIWKLLSPSERKKIFVILALMIAMALFEIVGIGSIMPFLAVLGNPDLIHTNIYLSKIYTYLSFNDKNSFLMFLGISALFTLVVSAFFKSITYYAQSRFSNMRRHSIGQRLLKKYLHQSYNFFLSRSSSEISKTILSESDMFVGQALTPSLKFITHFLITIFITFFLVVVDPILALILVLTFGIFYFIVYISIRKYLSKIGVLRIKANSSRFKIISEIIGGIKELKVLGREDVYLDSFKKPSYDYSSYSASNQILSQIPQFLIEAIAFGALLAMAMYALTGDEADLGKLLPILGLYALGAMKLKPAVNSMFAATATMKFGSSVVDSILNDLERVDEQINIHNDNKKLFLKKNLELKNIHFSYDNTNVKILQNIDITIKARTTVGIIGTTGSGKSTLVDIIIGLLSPCNGNIIIDDKLLSIENIRAWQNSIGYVSQHIFLSDDTIASNIAFGMEEDKIDIIQVERVAKMAQVHDMIFKLESGYNTKIGERGIRLSGGQRQRLGIARALYHNPELLILDEATSALDNKTELEVMNSINNMSGNKTIIMIAHRLSTIEKCDMILKLDNGIITSSKSIND